MRLSAAINGFLLAFVADGHSQNTVNIYKHHLRQLAAHLGDPDVETITPEQIVSFGAWLRSGYVPVRRGGDTSPYSPASISNAWCAVRSFYNWAAEALHIERPDETWKAPRWTRPDVLPFSQDDIQALLRAAEYSRYAKTETRAAFRMKRHNALRDVALILLLLDTGLRASEVARLRIEDASLMTGELYVMPWGSGQKTKSRHVYLGKVACKAVWRYLAERGEAKPGAALFVTRDGTPMDRINLRLVLVRLGKAAGVAGCYPHRFRHTFAVQYLRNGGDVFTLQRLLGHSTLDMVRRYLALADDDAQSAHRSASPVDRWRL